MKRIHQLWIYSIVFMVSLGLLFFSETSAGKMYIELYKNNTILVDESSQEQLFQAIKKDTIAIKLPQKSQLTVTEKNRKIYLHFSNKRLQESGNIEITNKTNKKTLTLPYKIDYQEPIIDMDITKNMLQKHIQEMPLSCEISAAADIISYFTGKEVKESTLLKILPKSKYNSIREINGETLYWGDPDKGFVGYIDYYGSPKIRPNQRLMTGYGVYEKPIEKIFQKFDLKTKTYNAQSFTPNFGETELLQTIISEFLGGSMVQLWGDRCTDPDYEDGVLEKGELTQGGIQDNKNEKNKCVSFYQNRNIFWQYKETDGSERTIKAYRGEHAFYLLGYKGQPDKPSHIIVWDTNTGRHVYPLKEWIRKWKALDYRTIIVNKK